MKITILQTDAGAMLFKSICGVTLIHRCGSKEFIATNPNVKDQSVLLIERNAAPPNAFTVFAINGNLVVCLQNAQDATTVLELVGVSVENQKTLDGDFMSENQLREVAQAVRSGALAAA